MPSFNDYFANMGQNALSGALSTRDALNERRDIQNRMSLQGQLPALIEQYGINSRNMPEEQKQANKQYLSLLAHTNPEEALKYLMQINRESQTNKNYGEISRAITDGLTAYKNAKSILEQASFVERSQRSDLKKTYNIELDNWLNAKARAAQYDATDAKFDSMGKLGAFEDYFNEKEKQSNSLKSQELALKTAEINQQIAQATLANKPLEVEKLKQELANANLEGKSKTLAIEDKKIGANLEKDKFVGIMDGIVDKMNSLATEFKNLSSTDARLVNSAKNAITKLFARKFSDEALSGGEYGQATGITGVNAILDRVSGGALDLAQMSDSQAIETARNLHKSYNDGLNMMRSRSGKVFRSPLNPSMSPMGLSGGQGGAQPQDNTPNPNTPNSRVSKKGRTS